MKSPESLAAECVRELHCIGFSCDCLGEACHHRTSAAERIAALVERERKRQRVLYIDDANTQRWDAKIARLEALVSSLLASEAVLRAALNKIESMALIINGEPQREWGFQDDQLNGAVANVCSAALSSSLGVGLRAAVEAVRDVCVVRVCGTLGANDTAAPVVAVLRTDLDTLVAAFLSALNKETE